MALLLTMVVGAYAQKALPASPDGKLEMNKEKPVLSRRQERAPRSVSQAPWQQSPANSGPRRGTPAGWTSLGQGTIVDDVLCKYFEKPSQTYSIEVQRDDHDANTYRLVELFGSSYPLFNTIKANGYNKQSSDVIEIDVSNPNNISISKAYVGWILDGEYELNFQASGGVLKDGVVTFRNAQILSNYNTVATGTLSVTLPDRVPTWTSVGQGAFTDEVFFPYYVASDPYKVEVEKKDGCDNIYRLVDPFGPVCPAFNTFKDISEYNFTAGSYIEIDISDPNNVTIANQNTGWNDYSFLCTIEATGGVLKDGVVTFSTGKFFRGEYLKITGTFIVTLPDLVPPPTWTTVGQGAFTDDVFLGHKVSMTGRETFNVEVQKLDGSDNIYRLVEPFGPSHPGYNEFYQLGEGNEIYTAGTYIELDISDPNNVTIARQKTGWAYASSSYDIEATGGVLKDGVVTFSYSAKYFLYGNLRNTGTLTVTLPDLVPGIVTEDFEGATAWAMDEPYHGFTFVNNDDGIAGGIFNDSSIPGEGLGYAYLVWNSDDEDNARGDYGAHSGVQSMAATYKTTPNKSAYVPNDSWMISPLQPGVAQTITFWVKSADSRYPDTYKVMSSSTGKALSDFSEVRAQATAPNTWTEVSVDLPTGTRYFAIVCNSDDGQTFLVDDITYYRGNASLDVAVAGCADGRVVYDGTEYQDGQSFSAALDLSLLSCKEVQGYIGTFTVDGTTITATYEPTWTSVGKGAFTDGAFMEVMNSDLLSPRYDVEVEKMDANANIYRLVEPFGTSHPLYTALETQYAAASYTVGSYLVLDITDPTNVTIAEQLVGWQFNTTSVTLSATGGVLADGVVTFDETVSFWENPGYSLIITLPDLAPDTWNDWEAFAPNGKSTGSFIYDSYWNRCDEGLNIYVRQSKEVATTKQFKIAGWAEGSDLIIDYDETTGLCHVLQQNTTSVNTELNQEVWVGDIAYMYSSYYYDLIYPCTYNPQTGTFSFYFIYYVPSLFGFDGWANTEQPEVFQIDGFKDYSFDVTYGDFTEDVAQKTGVQTVNIKPVGADFSKVVSTAITKAELEAIAADESKMNDIVAGLLTSQTPADNTTVDVNITEENTVILVAAMNEYGYYAHEYQYLELNYSPSAYWQSKGTYVLTDKLLSPYSRTDGQSSEVEVEVEENISTPGLLRIVNPYLIDCDDLETASCRKDVYLVIDATNPDAVEIADQLIGVNVIGHADEVSISTAQLGTLDADGIITFPTNGMKILSGDAVLKTGGFRLAPAKIDVTLPDCGIAAFSANRSLAIPEGLKAYYASEYEGAYMADGKIVVTEIVDIIPAHTGVLLISQDETREFTLKYSQESAEPIEGNMLVAVDGSMVTAENNYKLVDGEFQPLTGAETFGKNSAYLTWDGQDSSLKLSYGWTAWELFDPFYLSTGTYSNGCYWTGDGKNLTIYNRKSNDVDTDEQFKIENWGSGIDFIIDYDAATGICRVEPQSTTAVNTNNETIWVGDFYYLMGERYFNSYPCTYDASTGTFTLYLLYQPEAKLGTSKSLFNQGKAEIFQMDKLAYAVTLPASGIGTFSCDKNVVVPEGLKAYYAEECDGDDIAMTEIAGIIPAGTGVVLVSQSDAREFSLEATKATAAAIDGNLLVATDGSEVAQANNYILVSGAFHPMSKAGVIAEGKAYLHWIGASESLTMRFGDATIVDALTADPADDRVYNLLGQPAEMTQPGVYIQGGKKVLVK